MSPFRPVTAVRVYDGSVWRLVGSQGPPGPGPSAPDPPTNLDYVPSQTSLLITWDAPVGGEPVDFYELRVDGAVPVVEAGTQRTLTGLSPAATYRVEVRSVGEAPAGGGQALASGWVSLLAVTTGAPTGYSMRWGYTVGANGGGSNQSLAEYDRIAEFMGQAEVIRHFNTGTTFTVPVATYNSRIPDADFIISWKPNYSAIMNGSQDAYILTRVNAWPAGGRSLVLGAWHEWDVKKYGSSGVPSNAPQTEAQYAAMQNYLADLVHSAGRPNVFWAPILGAHNYQSRWDTMLAGGLDTSRYDFVLYDPYRSGSPGGYGYSNGRNQMTLITDYVKNTWGMPYTRQGIAEIGVGTTPPPSSQFQGAADYGRGAIEVALERKLWCVCWFEEGPNSYMIGNPPADGPALTARPQILSMWQAIRAANP